MTDRNHSLTKAAVFTALVFLAGLSAGYVLDVQRTDYLADEIRQANLEGDRFLVGQQYIDDRSANSCETMESYLSELSNTTRELGNDLRNLGEAGMFKQQSYDHLKQKYYIYQLRTWMAISEYRDKCDENVVTVLYFFTENTASQQQGPVLTQARQRHPERVFVFTFDMDADKTPIVDIVERDYNITQGPSLVINGDVHEGFVPLNELNNIIDSEINASETR